MTISIHIERYTQIRQWPHNISTIYLRQFYHIFTAISFNTQKQYIFTCGTNNHFLIEISLVLIRYIVFLYQSVVWFWSRSQKTWWSIFSRSNRRDDHQPLYRLWRVVSRPWVVRAAKLPLASYVCRDQICQRDMYCPRLLCANSILLPSRFPRQERLAVARRCPKWAIC